jgi:transposase
MNNDIKKLLGLQNIWIDSWDITDNKVIVKVRHPRNSCMCPHCTCNTKRVHSRKIRLIKHSIWQEKIVLLSLSVRRFYCSKCNKIFTEHIIGIDRRRTTKNYRDILLKQLSRNSLTYTTQTTKSSSSVLYSVLRESREANKKINWEEQGKNLTIGIDEHSFQGRRMALTLTNISKGKLITVLENDRKYTLDEWLKTADSKRVSEVCIDMRRMFLYSAKEHLPKAKVTVDKFHVIAYANKAMDEVRSIIVPKRKVRRLLFKGQERLSDKERIKLDGIFKEFKMYPSLYQAYFIKEKLRSFYRLRDKKEASRQLANIIMFCEESKSRYVKAIGRTLVFWREYILNYFNNYSTNAFTEGVHTKIKMLKRTSFGFRNIDNYIAKILLGFLPFVLDVHTF